jgi:hypothetical protein
MGLLVGAWLQSQPAAPPIIIKIADPPSELATLGGVLVRTLGLTGLLVLIALLLACVFGAVMFWIRSRAE